MAENKDNTEINESLSKIRQGISEQTNLSAEGQEKAIEKLDVVQQHVEENKVNESTTQYLRDIIQHLGESPNLIALVEEALAFLPH